jgi:hypothetical protein
MDYVTLQNTIAGTISNTNAETQMTMDTPSMEDGASVYATAGSILSLSFLRMSGQDLAQGTL